MAVERGDATPLSIASSPPDWRACPTGRRLGQLRSLRAGKAVSYRSRTSRAEPSFESLPVPCGWRGRVSAPAINYVVTRSITQLKCPAGHYDCASAQLLRKVTYAEFRSPVTAPLAGALVPEALQESPESSDWCLTLAVTPVPIAPEPSVTQRH